MSIIAALIIVSAGFYAIYINGPVVIEYLKLKQREVEALERIAAATEKKP